MTHWYVKELATLTGVSVRTLHHYDRMDLLKPSLRLDNGYRLYTEQDLQVLQQIIALKFLGFELKQIKALLQENLALFDHFSVQAKLIKQKADSLVKTSEALNAIVDECKQHKSVPWQHIIQLIEVYHMSEQLEHTWVSQFLNKDELKQYLAFEQSLPTRFSKEEQTEWEQQWYQLTVTIAEHIKDDPESDLGNSLAQRCMTLVDTLYGKDNLNLRTKVWEEGYKKNIAADTHGLNPEMIIWLDKAMNHYWRQLVYQLLATITEANASEPRGKWKQLLEDMYGHDSQAKQNLVDVALKDPKISDTAKTWLKHQMLCD